MNFKGLALLSICLFATTIGAQTAPTQQDLETRLKSQFLMLRGMWDGDKLTFDSQGNFNGSALTLPFSLSAVTVNKVRLADSQLEIEGRREGLEFHQPIKAVSWKSARKVHLSIAVDSQHPEALNAAIDKVFSIGVDQDLAANAPDYWQPWLRALLHLPGAGPLRPNDGALDETATAPSESPAGALPVATPDGIYRPGGRVNPPRLTYAPDPRFTVPARELKYHGIVVLGLVVNAKGRTERIHIVRPLGMGLDEQAVDVVSRYQFAPATLQGKPVPVRINIEVNFRIY